MNSIEFICSLIRGMNLMKIPGNLEEIQSISGLQKWSLLEFSYALYACQLNQGVIKMRYEGTKKEHIITYTSRSGMTKIEVHEPIREPKKWYCKIILLNSSYYKPPYAIFEIKNNCNGLYVVPVFVDRNSQIPGGHISFIQQLITKGVIPGFDYWEKKNLIYNLIPGVIA